jgi:long-chain acyl-CoA synthetase
MPHVGVGTAGAGTLCELFDRTAAKCGPQLALRSDDRWFALTWSEYAAGARAAAAGLAGIGVGRGDTVACWLRNRPELNVADAGALRLGAVPFSLHQRFTVAQAERVIADAASRVLVTEPTFLRSALAVRDARRTALETIVLVDGADARALTWTELLDCASAGFDADATARTVAPDDLATMIYDSGRGGPPAAGHLTHRDIVSLVALLPGGLALPIGVRVDSRLSMAHLAVRLCAHYLPMALGWSVTTGSPIRGNRR